MKEREPIPQVRKEVVFGTLPDGSIGELDYASNIPDLQTSKAAEKTPKP